MGNRLEGMVDIATVAVVAIWVNKIGAAIRRTRRKKYPHYQRQHLLPKRPFHTDPL
jgi:hypothetical protein